MVSVVLLISLLTLLGHIQYKARIYDARDKRRKDFIHDVPGDLRSGMKLKFENMASMLDNLRSKMDSEFDKLGSKLTNMIAQLESQTK